MTAPAMPPAIAKALERHLTQPRAELRHLYEQMVGGAVTNTSRAASGLLGPAIARLEAAEPALEAAIAAELAPRVAHDDACGLGEGTHFACECTLRRLAELEAEVARLRNGLAIAESFVRTADAELKEARAVLAEIQWSGGYEPHCAGRCPMCEAEVEWDRSKTPTHFPGCRLAALLQGGTP